MLAGKRGIVNKSLESTLIRSKRQKLFLVLIKTIELAFCQIGMERGEGVGVLFVGPAGKIKKNCTFGRKNQCKDHLFNKKSF